MHVRSTSVLRFVALDRGPRRGGPRIRRGAPAKESEHCPRARFSSIEALSRRSFSSGQRALSTQRRASLLCETPGHVVARAATSQDGLIRRWRTRRRSSGRRCWSPRRTFRRLDASELLAEVAEGVVYATESGWSRARTRPRSWPPPKLI